MILMAFLLFRGNIISLAFCSSFDTPPSLGLRSYFTLSAYRSVLRVFSDEAEEGETLPIMKVRQKPTKESFSTIVSFDPRKGVCPLPWSSALMHSLSERSDLLIYAPSILVCLFMSMWSAPLSLPARSINDILPNSFFPSLSEICRMACDREESALAEFIEVTLCWLPMLRYSMNYSVLVTCAYSMPMMLMLLLLSYRSLSSVRLFSRSNSLPQ